MDEPLRHAALHLAALERLLQADSEAELERRRLSSQIQKMAAVVKRLAELPPDPDD